MLSGSYVWKTQYVMILIHRAKMYLNELLSKPILEI